MDIENEDYVVEEYNVYIEFENNLTSLETDDNNLDLKIIGIDSDNPVVEVNGKIFKGNYDYSYCTNIFFERGSDPPILETIYEKVPENLYSLVGKTNKKITMNRLFIESKVQTTDMINQVQSVNNMEYETLEELKGRLELNSTYEGSLNLFLPQGKQPPRKIDINGHVTEINENNSIIPSFKNQREACEYIEDCDDDSIKDPDYIPLRDDF